ncbi:VOC family protein [Oculatella sp. LEGE 06141]|uniref:VOC family protein n=1 Tax=Oculatella sp. LEGE 06141 TaxID=1828648 RepID=UPI0018826B4E|nr:VOC family protein [Oculatella sp. LEGE 06141]MBE9177665.1 VOC family protein [Oculatella sp. LEGE 06141]
MHIDRLDHLVLTVSNIETTCRFYTQVLGMNVVTFGDDRKALHFGQQKINLHELGNEIDPKAHHPTVGSADLCFITTMPLPEVVTHIQSCGVELETGIVSRTGATGAIRSVYLRDPDGNLLEISNRLSVF